MSYKRLSSLNCKLCLKSFSSSVSLTQHFKSIHKGITHACYFCTKLFTTRGFLKSHIDTVHLRLKSFMCMYCDKVQAWYILCMLVKQNRRTTNSCLNLFSVKERKWRFTLPNISIAVNFKLLQNLSSVRYISYAYCYENSYLRNLFSQIIIAYVKRKYFFVKYLVIFYQIKSKHL